LNSHFRWVLVALVSAATTSVAENNNASVICVCFLEEVSEARVSYTTRRLARNVQSAKVLVALLGKTLGGETEPDAAVDSNMVVRSLGTTLDAISTLTNQKRIDATPRS
jgi:hypothetical protein